MIDSLFEDVLFEVETSQVYLARARFHTVLIRFARLAIQGSSLRLVLKLTARLFISIFVFVFRFQDSTAPSFLLKLRLVSYQRFDHSFRYSALGLIEIK